MRGCAALCWLAIFMGARAAPAHAETMAEIVATALAHNPDLLAQAASLRISEEGVVQARSLLGPTVQVQASALYGRASVESVHYAGASHSADLSLTQPIYSGGRGHARITEAQARLLAARSAYVQAEMRLLQQVVTAYAAVRRDQALIEIAEANLSTLQVQLQSVQARFDLHEATLTDLAQAQARLAGARTTSASNRNQLGASRGAFLAAVGRNPGDLAPEPPLNDLPTDIDEAFATAEAKAPGVLSAIFTEAASRAQIEEVKAAGRPSVSLQASYAEEPLNTYDPRFSESSAQIQAVYSQTLFTSGAQSSQVRAAVEQNNRDRILIESARREALRLVSQAWGGLQAARSAVISGGEQVRAEQAAFIGVQEEQRVGLRTVLDVLNAEAELRSAQQQLAQSRYDELSNGVALLAAMGGLSPASLGADAVHAPAGTARRDLVPWIGLIDRIDRLGTRPLIPLVPAHGLHPDGQAASMNSQAHAPG